jgi:hypothetical protein
VFERELLGVLHKSVAEFALSHQSKRVMLIHHRRSHLLSNLFPDLGHPVYQSGLETITFLVVTLMLVGALIGALALVIYEL